MPPDLKARVKAAAEANNRSMNAEIVATLEEKYPAPRPSQELAAALREIIDEISLIEDPEAQLSAWKEARTTAIDALLHGLADRQEDGGPKGRMPDNQLFGQIEEYLLKLRANTPTQFRGINSKPNLAPKAEATSTRVRTRNRPKPD